MIPPYSLIYGDFFEMYPQLPPDSVDCIITDPPYPKKYLGYWEKLAVAGVHLLKPSGFLVTYTPQFYLDRIVGDITKHLTYYCCIAMIHSGARSTIFPRKEICAYKPVFVYQKPPITKPYKTFVDVIHGTGREKNLHKWQQAEDELKPIIETFCPPEGVIMDPFMGSGTTLACAVKLGRHAIGYDNDLANIDVVKKRLE